MEHTEEHAQEEKNFLWWVWQLFFVLMYPVLVTFSLVFTTILWVFSTLSRVLFWIFKKFPRRT